MQLHVISHSDSVHKRWQDGIFKAEQVRELSIVCFWISICFNWLLSITVIFVFCSLFCVEDTILSSIVYVDIKTDNVLIAHHKSFAVSVTRAPVKRSPIIMYLWKSVSSDIAASLLKNDACIQHLMKVLRNPYLLFSRTSGGIFLLQLVHLYCRCEMQCNFSPVFLLFSRTPVYINRLAANGSVMSHW